MANVPKLRGWLPVLWAGLAMVILAGDYLAGPFVSLTVLFVVPVALAARYSGAGWGITWGVVLPMMHFGLTLLWPPERPVADSLINAVIRAGVLVVFAVLIDRTTQQAREIRVLRGLIPVCAFCKKIRTEDQQWQPIEFYITERSEATFTSTFCPECARKHYGEYYEQFNRSKTENTNTGGGAGPSSH